MKFRLLLFASFAMLLSCSDSEEITKEEWAGKPVAEWPDIVFTNNIEFTDTTYTELGNAFLIDTGNDTLAVTCKHIFLAFKHDELLTIDPGDGLISWTAGMKGGGGKAVKFGKMINKDPSEEVGRFNTLKVRDWLIFEPDNIPDEVELFKIRWRPVQKGETMYSYGWTHDQKGDSPSLVRMEMFNNPGPYYYIRTLTENVDNKGRSGSPVFDSAGHLVGIASGAEGDMGVICNVNYLKKYLDNSEE